MGVSAGVGSGAIAPGVGHGGPDGALDGVSEDNRRTMSYIADLLNENTREAALLELSKKREQVPELALILWHSFGKHKKEETRERGEDVGPETKERSEVTQLAMMLTMAPLCQA